MLDISSFFERYRTAVFEKDLPAFLSLFDPQVQVFDMWAQWVHEGQEAWRGMAAEWFGSLGKERVLVQFEDERHVVSGKMAYATATARFTALSPEGEKLRSLQNRFTWVFQDKGGTWKIVHEHTSAPADHASGKLILERPAT